MSPIEKNIPLAEHIRITLSDDILSGSIIAGARLDEVVLATRFNVSRTPVREALKQLISSGLVKHRHRCGVFVSQIPIDRLAEMFEYVAEMEALCARLAAVNMTKGEKDEMLAIHIDSQQHVISGDINAYDQSNVLFHTALFQGCHNQYLKEAVISAKANVAPYRRAQFNIIDRAKSSFSEHEEIMKLLIQGEADEVSEAMLAHIKQSFLASSNYIHK